MRARSFQQKMQWLAMLALLLLAAMPTIGRICAVGTSTNTEGSPGFCQMAGMKHMPMVETASGHPMPGNTDHDDCAYCPLLHALATVAVLVLLLLPQCALHRVEGRRRTLRIVAIYPCGLGSRGPPAGCAIAA